MRMIGIYMTPNNSSGGARPDASQSEVKNTTMG
eukprot:CAMPEP_0115556806 /NCGR_PEP_ID=MMETSP0271-20121206/98571_1 /TAXON_ID=71861 /ORGANISM="Scrippsiella trochoidea, Strain CCMP3099" /LENGTH=32 /DNA_ID= /DNA_START= /DNA_END= /DNA_ORIENTATION=